MFKVYKVLIIAVLCFHLTGCATIFKQKNRTVSFDSEPQGADIYINGNRMGKTPAPLILSNKDTVTATFRKDGFDEKSQVIRSDVGIGWLILDVLGGLIPVVIDAATNNWQNLDTKEVKVLLDRK